MADVRAMADLDAEDANGGSGASRPDALTKSLTWQGIQDCTCEYDWRGLGVLYGVSMGKGWVRMSTDPTCPHHRPEEVTR